MESVLSKTNKLRSLRNELSKSFDDAAATASGSECKFGTIGDFPGLRVLGDQVSVVFVS